jgi:hypothetical protein
MTVYQHIREKIQCVADCVKPAPKVNKIMADYLRRRLRDNPASRTQLGIVENLTDAQLIAAYKRHKGLL